MTRALEIADPAQRSMLVERPPIVLTALDHNALLALLSTDAKMDESVARFLREELDRADIARGSLAPNAVASFGSIVKFIDHGSTHIQHVCIVCPNEANGADAISVTSSLGAALVGLGPGQTICWFDGFNQRRTTVLEIKPRTP